MLAQPATQRSAGAQLRPVRMRCPACKHALRALPLSDPDERAACTACQFVIASQGGIWRALPPLRDLFYRRFATEYSLVREREGRGSPTAEYYLELPYHDLNGRNTRQWQIRARSFDYLRSRVLPAIEGRFGRHLRVLDLGAGNGWLSYRLAQRGYDCAAVDVLDDPLAGLGAGKHYAGRFLRPFVCVQAEMDNLPFVDGQFDLAIFNGSFHYSEDYTRTLRETLRCLRAGAEVVIVDTPYYQREESGRAMVQEQFENFREKYGFRPDSLRSREYLTPERLQELAAACGLRWQIGRPWYGVSWALRPWQAKLQGRPAPAEAYVLSATAGGR